MYRCKLKDNPSTCCFGRFCLRDNRSIELRLKWDHTTARTSWLIENSPWRLPIDASAVACTLYLHTEFFAFIVGTELKVASCDRLLHAISTMADMLPLCLMADDLLQVKVSDVMLIERSFTIKIFNSRTYWYIRVLATVDRQKATGTWLAHDVMPFEQTPSHLRS